MIRVLSALAVVLFLSTSMVWAEEKPAAAATETVKATTPPSAADGVFKTQIAKVSYAIGMNMGNMLKAQYIEPDLDALTRGIKDVLAGGKPLMTDKEVTETFRAFQTEHQVTVEKKKKELGEKNKAEGDKYLAANKTKEGVKTTASGLQYKVIKEGTGAQPKDTDTVKVHYTGKLLNGNVFDSSVDRGQPATFQANRVIKGWTEALQLMKVGSKWELTIPSELAYGPNGSGARIPPNSVLVFEVELLNIEPPSTAPAPRIRMNPPAGGATTKPATPAAPK
ncbi:MAG: FKBP-type peptidyl-prolyl cis-trans isomerase [Phycisphaerae bacterium]|nr:FKBP-type peptidyl-prolyl cis-trans isomerase [Phycisphaerae bacterium]